MIQKFARTGALLAAIATVFSSTSAVWANSIPPVFRDPDNNIYVTGQSPQTRVQLTYQGMMRSRDYQANSCGWILLRNSTTNPIAGTINVGGTSVNTATLPTQLLPGCNNGIAEETRAANFKTTTGDVVVVGRTPGGYVTVQTPQDRVRNATANACGVARFASSTSYQHAANTQIQIAAAPDASQISDLTARDGILCSRGNLYVPASWLAGGGS